MQLELCLPRLCSDGSDIGTGRQVSMVTWTLESDPFRGSWEQEPGEGVLSLLSWVPHVLCCLREAIGICRGPDSQGAGRHQWS